MKLKNNKKAAMLFSILIVFVTFFVLLYAYIQLTDKYNDFDQKIGLRQLSLLKAEADKELSLIYNDLIAKHAIKKSYLGLNNNGGLFNKDCGEVYGYSLWNNKEKECYPNTQTELPLFIQSNLSTDYEITIGQNIKGFSYNFLEQNIYCTQQGFNKYWGWTFQPDQDFMCGKLTYKHNFKLPLKKDLSAYNDLIDKSKELIQKCQIESDVQGCVNKISKENNWQLVQLEENTNNHFAFNYNNIKFALFIPDKVPPSETQFISVSDNKVTEGSVLINFKPNPETDIKHYNIYYEKSPLIILKSIVPSQVKNKKTINQFDYTYNDYTHNKENLYKFSTEEESTFKRFEPGKLYYFTPTEKDSYYIYVLNNLEDNKNHLFAMTATDYSGNERITAKIKYGSSIDDLYAEPIQEIEVTPISDQIQLTWKMPEKNIDGTEFDDFSHYNIYCLENNVMTESTPITTTQETITTNKCNYYTITAIDQTGNENKNFNFVESS